MSYLCSGVSIAVTVVRRTRGSRKRLVTDNGRVNGPWNGEINTCYWLR